jgi:TM2 domain-containing membrane protein YozV
MSEQTEIEAERSPFNWTAVFFISLFLGLIGIDRFYTGKKISDVIKLLTHGGSGIWWLIDLLIIATTLCLLNREAAGAAGSRSSKMTRRRHNEIHFNH